jgi:hypothetical protein
VRGGDVEYAVATVMITSPLQRWYDDGRLEAIAREAVNVAEEHPASPPPKPGARILTYP